MVRQPRARMENLMLATTLGQLAHLGVINQGIVNIIGQRVGNVLADYIIESGEKLPKDDVVLT